MILELVYIGGSTMNPQSQSNIQTISYKNSSDLMSELNKIEAGCKYTTLVIWGGHGSQTGMCGLDASELARIVDILKEKGFTFDTIVLDACESAIHAQTFKDLLNKEGRILCHLGVNKVQIIQDRDGIVGTTEETESKTIRNKWFIPINNAFTSTKEEDIYLKTALIPAVYVEEQSRMCHICDENHIDETGESNPFTKNDLAKNLKATGSTEVQFGEFQDYILKELENI